MARRPAGIVLRHLRTIFESGGLDDGQLIARFAARDGPAAEDAFAALVERHGPLVMRVCRGVLRDEHAAQDAFQATFLVLARKARSLWVRESLGPWLHSVALRIASAARSAAARRRSHERRAAEHADRSVGDATGDADRWSALHEELERLPERYRVAVMLCDLEGLSHGQAARQLGWPIGTVKSRQARGRARLRSRLLRRGFAPSLMMPAPIPRFSSCVPEPLLGRTTAAALATTGPSSTTTAIPAAVTALVGGALRTMMMTRFAAFVAVVLGGSTAVIAAWTLGNEAGWVEPRAAPATAPQEEASTPLHRMRPPAPIELDSVAIAGETDVATRDERGNLAEDPDHPGAVLTHKAPISLVITTGVLDQLGLRQAIAREVAAGLPTVRPRYRRIDLQRQRLLDDGEWTPWEMVDTDAIAAASHDIAHEMENVTPVGVRASELVAWIPFLSRGGDSIDPDRFLAARFRGEPGREESGAVTMHNAPMPMPRGVDIHDAPMLMIRGVDLTVAPGVSYRYRVRVVIDDPRPGLHGNRELAGQWSEPTAPATVPVPVDGPDEAS